MGLVQTGMADVLHMKDGQKQVGIIVNNASDGRMITIRTTSGELSIPRSKIARVDSVSAGESHAQLGDEYLAAGNFEQAIATFEAGLQLDPNNLDLQQKLQEARGGVLNQQAQAQSVLDSKTRRVIDQAMRAARQGNFDAGYTMFRSIEPSDVSPVYAQYRSALAEFFLLWGDYLNDHQNTGEASKKYSEVLKLEPENARAKQMLIRTFEGDPTKLQETAEYYLQQEDPEDQLKGAESLFKLQQYEQALPIFLKYIDDPDLNHRYNLTNRAISMLDTLHKQYATRGDYRTAVHYFQEYMRLNPEADPLPYSKYVYMIQRGQTDMNSPAARLRLAELGEGLGLVDVAKEEYRNVLTLDAKSTGALAALRRFAERDLQDARDFLAQGQYKLAEQKAQAFVAEYGTYPDLVAQANRVQAQAQVEAQKVAQNTRQQAIALAERGDNYYQQAQQYIGAYVSTEVDINKRFFSPREEAAKYLGQAIFAWRTALQLDQSLGDPTTYNLYFKIQDASAKYAQIANRRPPPMPPRVNRSLRTNTSSNTNP